MSAAIMAIGVGNAVAGPQDGVVSAGAASITTSGLTTTINQSTHKAIIDWRSFDIGATETTQFVQPSSTSITLNRVNSSSASYIDGRLIANGNVFIVNQNGVLFGKNAVIDVNGLVASTADIDNNNFMNGNFRFDRVGKADAVIENRGLITAGEAGLVGLVAPNVLNSGVIHAKLGRVHLASGDRTTVDLYGDGLMEVAADDPTSKRLVQNTGRIQAEGGTIALTASAGAHMVDNLIRVSGELRAPSVGVKNGKIIIAAEGSNAVTGNVKADKNKKTGTSTVIVQDAILDASGRNPGERGGKIMVTGDNVALLAGTFIDVSGYQGLSDTTLNGKLSDVRTGAAGGDIRIGGDYLGGGITPTAQNLYVDKDVLVLNDSLYEGDAGRTIFWSDGNTEFYGNVYARALGGLPVDPVTWHAMDAMAVLPPDQRRRGIGGFVETSGHNHLDAGGYVDLTSSNGDKGTYFLDPTNITIYGNFAPDYSTVIQGDATTLASSLKLWLDASDTSNVNLTYNSMGTTANGTSGANTITVGSATGLTIGARVRLGAAGAVTAASTVGADTYTISNIVGTTITLSSSLTTNYTGSALYQGYASQLTDKSGTGHSASTATPANMPLWISNGQNGLGITRFNGSNRLDVSGLATGTLFVTGQRNADNSNIWFEGTSGIIGSGRGFSFLGPHNQIYYLNESAYLNGAQRLIYDYSGTLSTPLIMSAYDTNLTPNLSFGIGYATPGFTRLNGTINELVDYSTLLSTNARNLVEQYQSAKWGIALTPPGTGGTEVAKATASDGYSVFTTRYLERLSQSANVSLQATNNINLDFKGDTLNFTTAGRSLTLTAGNQITTASTGAVTTNNGAISLTGANGIAINNNFTFNSGSAATTLNTTNSPISFSGTSSFGGATSLNSGSGALTFGGAITNNGGLTLNSSANNTIGQIISGTGAFTQSGSGTTTLAGANTYTGTTNINAGTVNLSGSLSGTTILNIVSGATLNYTGAAAYNKINYSGTTWNIAGTLNNQLGVGTVAQTLAPTVNLNGGTITGLGVTADTWGDFANSQSTTITVTGTSTISGILRGNSQLRLSPTGSSDTLQVTGILGNGPGTLSLIKNGSGTLTLSGANTYTGTTTVNAGTLGLSGSWNVGAGTATTSVASGATLNGAGVITAGTLADSGLGTVSLTGNNLITNLTTTGSIGDLTFNNAQSFTSGAVTTAAGKTINLSASGAGNSITTTGAIATGAAGNISLTADNLALGGNLSGTGTLTLQPKATNRIVRVNSGASDFNLSTAELAYLVDGWGQINLGRTDAISGANLVLNSSTWYDPLNIRGFYTQLAGTIAGLGNASFTLSSVLGAFTSAPTLSTQGGNIAITSGYFAQASGNTNITTNGGSFSLTNANIDAGFGSPTDVGQFNVNTSGGNINLRGINQNALSTNLYSFDAGAGSFTLSNTINSAANISISANNISFAQGLGASTSLGNVTLNSTNSLSLPAITTAAGKTVSATVTGAGNSITTTGAIATGAAGNITLTADDLVLGANLSGTGTLTLKPNASTQALKVGGAYTGVSAGYMTLSTTELGYFLNGWSLINIGNILTSNYSYFGTESWSDPVNFLSAYGRYIDGNITGTGDASLTFTNGWINIRNSTNLTTSGGAIDASATLMNSESVGGGIYSNGGNIHLGSFQLRPATTTFTINSSGGNISFASTLNENGGATTGKNLVLTAGAGNISFGGTVNGAYNLSLTANNVSFAGNWGSTTALGNVSLISIDSLILPTITGSSVFAQTTGVASDITIGAGKTLSASGAGNAVTLVSGRNFVNNSGSSTPINLTGGGRYQIYSTNPSADTLGGMTGGFVRYGCTYGGSCPAGVSIPGTGNGHIYIYRPTLTVTPSALAVITYGDSIPSLSGYAYGVAGYLTGAAGSDSGADALSGALTGSTTYTPTSNVGNYNINYASGTLASTLGYQFSYANNATAITVNKKQLTATANGQIVTYGTAVPGSTIMYTGFVNGEDDSVIDTLATLSSANSGIINTGSYIGNYTTFGAVDNNYSFNYVAGDLTVNKKTLDVTADGQTVTYGTNAPGSTTLSYNGFITGEDETFLTTAPIVTSLQSGVVNAGSYVGNYGVSGGVSDNYSFNYVAGDLNVVKKNLVVTANNQIIPYGVLVPSTTTLLYNGFIGGEDDTVLDTAPTVSSGLSGIQVVGTYVGNYSVGGAVDNNYSLTYVHGDLIITPVPMPPSAGGSTSDLPNTFVYTSQNPMPSLNINPSVVVTPVVYSIQDTDLSDTQISVNGSGPTGEGNDEKDEGTSGEGRERDVTGNSASTLQIIITPELARYLNLNQSDILSMNASATAH